jgi:hypothetical protein
LFEARPLQSAEIDAGMKAEAIEAIESLQTDLALTEAETKPEPEPR